MAVKTNPYSAQSPLRYLLDAGAIYKNITFDGLLQEFSGELLGATSGGNEFALAVTTRVMTADGVKGSQKGNVLIDEEIPELTVNLKELTAQNIALAIAGSKLDTTSEIEYDIITSKGKIELGDYLTNIAFVGRLTGSNKPVVIVIDNALALEGLTLTTQDQNESVIPIKFTGHYDDVSVVSGVPPYKIYWPKEVV